MPSVSGHLTSFDGSTNQYDDPGNVTWSNPTNAGASDDARATVAMNSALPPIGVSYYLFSTDMDSSVDAIPSNATILGIQVDIERKKVAGLGNPKDLVLRLIKAGSMVGDDKASADTYPGADAIKTYGGAADLWGTTWTVAQVQASNFGVALACKSELGTGTAGIDDIIVTITYSVPATGPTARTARSTHVGFKAKMGEMNTKV